MRSADQIADRVALAVLALTALIAAATFRDYGLGWDDYTHSEYGDLLLALYGSGFRDDRALHFVNLYKYGGGFDMAAALAAKISPFDLFETRRLLGAAVGLVGLAATWRIGRFVGGPLAGLFALLFLVLTPFYYGHMFMNAKDAPFATAMAILLYALVRVFAAFPQPARRDIVFLGVGIGLALGTRILGALAVLYAVAALLLIAVAEARDRGARFALARAGNFLWLVLPAAAVGYLLMGLLWPWAILSPFNPLDAAAYFSEFFEKPWQELYEGHLISVPDMPVDYALHLLALKLPEIVLVLGLVGSATASFALFRRGVAPQRRAILLLLLLAALLPLAIALVSHPAYYNGIRQFVFIAPAFAVLGGLAAAGIVAGARRYGPSAVVAAVSLIVAALSLPLGDMVRLHPYQYVAFNRFVGGVPGAVNNYMIDYWGLAFKQASEELRHVLAERNESPPRGRRWRVAVCGPQRGPQVALGRNFETTADPRGADFAMMRVVFYCRALDAPLLVNIEREDVPFARVYDIRGLRVRELLTQPPP